MKTLVKNKVMDWYANILIPDLDTRTAYIFPQKYPWNN